MCPHTTIMCPHTNINVSTCYYVVCVLTQHIFRQHGRGQMYSCQQVGPVVPPVCPHTTTHVSSYDYICATSVSSYYLLHVSSYDYICVLILHIYYLYSGSAGGGKCMEANRWGPLCDECGHDATSADQSKCSCLWNYGTCPLKAGEAILFFHTSLHATIRVCVLILLYSVRALWNYDTCSLKAGAPNKSSYYYTYRYTYR